MRDVDLIAIPMYFFATVARAITARAIIAGIKHRIKHFSSLDQHFEPQSEV